MIIPNNLIISKYTAGKEYMTINSYQEYVGYYYVLNNKVFAGMVFDPNATELQKIKSPNINSLLLNAASYVYGKLSGIQISSTVTTPQSYTFNPKNVTGTSVTRYFLKYANSNPILIKEVTQSTYNQFINNNSYQGISLVWSTTTGFNQTSVLTADKIVQGIYSYIYM